MPIADVPNYVPAAVPYFFLDGMTLLLGGFFFYSLARPNTVRNRAQFWAVFVCLLAIILLYTLRLMLSDSAAGQVFTGVMIGLLQAAGLVLTVMYVGGLRASDLAEELRDAAEDFRGQPAKTPIVPLKAEQPRPGPPVVPMPASPAAAEPPRVVIDLPKSPPSERIPLE